MLRAVILSALTAMVLISLQVAAQTAEPETPPEFSVEPPMTVVRLAEIMMLIDPDAVVEPGGITLTVNDIPVTVVVDPRANRMRILVPISSAEALSEEDLMRLLQANFDTALDARYAIANGRLWSTFIHSLQELGQNELISGLAQTVTLAQTYGDTYTSGALMFGGGDTRDLIRELLDLGDEL